MTETQALLADYVANESEAAFRELVRRYVDLVYSTAVRLVDGNSHLAQDVAQTVFIDLARTAHKLPQPLMLGGWLHRHTCFIAGKLLRSERRRHNRERQAMEQRAQEAESGSNWAQLRPMLDEAIDLLGEADRTAILLRFFEQCDFKAVGSALGSNEDAARMRVNRALDKLEGLLKVRGVRLSAAALATTLAASAVSAAPSGLAASLAGSALAAAATGSSLLMGLLKITAMTKLKLGIVSAIVLATAAIPLVVQNQSLRQLRLENNALRQQLNGAAELETENNRLSNLLVQANGTQALSQSERTELLRLRGQIGALRKEAAKATTRAPAATAVAQPTEASVSVDDYQKQAAIAKMEYVKNWMVAFFSFSQSNQGQFPTNLEQALSYLPDTARTEHNLQPAEFPPGKPKFGLTPDQYEIVYTGSPDAILNPQDIIVLREKEPWQVADGGWVRAYGFADGHTEIHRATDGDFRSWEARHLFAPAH